MKPDVGDVLEATQDDVTLRIIIAAVDDEGRVFARRIGRREGAGPWEKGNGAVSRWDLSSLEWRYATPDDTAPRA